MEENNFYNMIQQAQACSLQKILDCNTYTKKFGLSLAPEEAQQLAQGRMASLKEQERLELGEGILPKLIFTFCDSPYIYQDNYAETIEALQELFYLYKTEAMEELTDDELLTYMKEHFDGESQGSLEYLEEKCLEDFCRQIRKGGRESIQQEDEYDY